MYIVNLPGSTLVSAHKRDSFRAVVDVAQGKQIASTEVQQPIADRQSNAVGKMAAIWTIDNAGTQNHQFESIALLVFPEQLFLAQFRVRVMITPFGVRFEHCLLVHQRATAQTSHSIYSE